MYKTKECSECIPPQKNFDELNEVELSVYSVMKNESDNHFVSYACVYNFLQSGPDTDHDVLPWLEGCLLFLQGEVLPGYSAGDPQCEPRNRAGQYQTQ